MKKTCKGLLSIFIALAMTAMISTSAFAVSKTAEDIANELGCETLNSVSDFSLSLDSYYHIYFFEPTQRGLFRLTSHEDTIQVSCYLTAYVYDASTFDYGNYCDALSNGRDKLSALTLSLNCLNSYSTEDFYMNGFDMTVGMLENTKYIIVIKHTFNDTNSIVPISFSYLGELIMAEFVSFPNKLDYTLGTEIYDNESLGLNFLSCEGCEIKLTFKNGDTMTFIGDECKEFLGDKCLPGIPGTYMIDLNIFYFILSYRIEIIANPIQSIEIVSKPDKLVYRYPTDGRVIYSFSGMDLNVYFYPKIDCTGMIIKINYRNGSSKTVDVSGNDGERNSSFDGGYFEYDGYLGSVSMSSASVEPGTNSMYVEYCGVKSESFDVSVVKQLFSAEMFKINFYRFIFSTLSKLEMILTGNGDRVLSNDSIWFRLLRLGPYLNYNSHYTLNSNLEGDMGYIYDQRSCPDFYIGDRNMSGVGCEIAAVYNALKRLNKNVKCSEIIRDFERNGYLMASGIFGSDPYAIEKYFEFKSIDYTQYDSLDKMQTAISAQSSIERVYILSFWNYDTIDYGLHTVALYKKANSEKIFVYNSGRSGDAASGIEDLKWLTDSKCFITGYCVYG